MPDKVDFAKLPPVEKIQGLYFDGERALVQYLSSGTTYELAFPLTEVFQMDEWFIQLRRQIGSQFMRD